MKKAKITSQFGAKSIDHADIGVIHMNDGYEGPILKGRCYIKYHPRGMDSLLIRYQLTFLGKFYSVGIENTYPDILERYPTVDLYLNYTNYRMILELLEQVPEWKVKIMLWLQKHNFIPRKAIEDDRRTIIPVEVEDISVGTVTVNQGYDQDKGPTRH